MPIDMLIEQYYVVTYYFQLFLAIPPLVSMAPCPLTTPLEGADTDRALALLAVVLPRLVDVVDDIEPLMRAGDATAMRAAAEAVSVDVHQ